MPKAARMYPAEDAPARNPSQVQNPTKLRASITPGTVRVEPPDGCLPGAVCCGRVEERTAAPGARPSGHLAPLDQSCGA